MLNAHGQTVYFSRLKSSLSINTYYYQYCTRSTKQVHCCSNM